jgi:RimJ/RimL family protein N-acetyltransferase
VPSWTQDGWLSFTRPAWHDGRRPVEEVLVLRFDPAVPGDAEELFPIMADPRSWWFEPGARHREITTTQAWLERASRRWSIDGLSYWSVRSATTGELVGVGGVQRHRSGDWNLSYRIGVEHQRQGFALELGRAGLTAAHRADPDSAVVAWVLESNEPSRRVAERLGLRPQGPRVDANDGVVRLAYADRDLTPDPSDTSCSTPTGAERGSRPHRRLPPLRRWR